MFVLVPGLKISMPHSTTQFIWRDINQKIYLKKQYYMHAILQFQNDSQRYLICKIMSECR